MIIDYPSYYETFHCVGGSCPDSCCIGWEVDIDRDTCRYYRSVRGPFGDRLRSHMRRDGDDVYFPLDENGRCPFLNRENLCDIIIALGEESLSQVCTEYPRYFLEEGDFEQIDLSLSCMELGRIFFEGTEPIEYIREEIASPDDISGGMAKESSDKDSDGSPDFSSVSLCSEKSSCHGTDARSGSLLAEILDIRDDCIGIMEDRSRPFAQRFLDVLRLYGPDEWKAVLPAHAASPEDLLSGAGPDPSVSLYPLLKRMDRLEVIDERWTDRLAEIRSLLPEMQARLKEDAGGTQAENPDPPSKLQTCPEQTAGRMRAADPELSQHPQPHLPQPSPDGSASYWRLLSRATDGLFPVWSEKLACYFLFRYVTDAYFAEKTAAPKKGPAPEAHPGVAASVRFSARALCFLYLMCISAYERNGGRFDVRDMTDLAHLYSREVEHSDENVALLKMP